MAQKPSSSLTASERVLPRLALLSTEMLPVPPIRGGAVQTYIAAIAPLLTRWFDVTVVCVSDPDLEDVETLDDVTYVRVPEPHAMRYYENAMGFLQSQRWEVVVVYNQPRAVIWASAAAPNAAIFFSMHNLMFDPALTPPELATACLEVLDGVFTVSRYVAAQSVQSYPAFAHLFHPVNAGVDLDRFSQERKPESLPVKGLAEWLGNKNPVLLTVARLVRGKGTHVLLEAMKSLIKDYPKLGLIIVGNAAFGKVEPSEYEQFLHRQAEVLGDSVFFTGFVPNKVVDPLFAVADIFVCNSLWPEALARVHYEAMAASLPIVTTNRGGNPEVIEPGENGFIYRPAESVQSLIECLKPLIENEALRNRLGATGRRLAESHYGWNHTANRMATILGKYAAVPEGVNEC